jgi:hypothetical protein
LIFQHLAFLTALPRERHFPQESNRWMPHQ